jgi:hypothetical protein
MCSGDLPTLSVRSGRIFFHETSDKDGVQHYPTESNNDQEKGSTPKTPISPKTPQTAVTTNSYIDLWTEAAETLIILDWDDTLCPSTWISKHSRLRWNQVAPCFRLAATEEAAASKEGYPHAPNLTQQEMVLRGILQLERIKTLDEDAIMLERITQHTNTVAALLRLAVTLGKVVIVTLAEEHWVETSIRNFMPELQGLLEELEIEIHFAKKMNRPRYFRVAKEEPGHDLGQILKQDTMTQVVKKFYSQNDSRRRRGKTQSLSARSWKNIISVGDSPCEGLALQDIVFRHKQFTSSGVTKTCRCKVLKMVEFPTLERLTAELQVLMVWLQKLAHHDGDIDVDLEDIEDDTSPSSPLARLSIFGTPKRKRAVTDDL